jgi:hypothetical protein
VTVWVVLNSMSVALGGGEVALIQGLARMNIHELRGSP